MWSSCLAPEMESQKHRASEWEQNAESIPVQFDGRGNRGPEKVSNWCKVAQQFCGVAALRLERWSHPHSLRLYLSLEAWRR